MCKSKIFIILSFLIIGVSIILCKGYFPKIDGSYVWYSEPRAIKVQDNFYLGLIDNYGNIKVVHNKNNEKYEEIRIKSGFQINILHKKYQNWKNLDCKIQQCSLL